MYPRADCRKDHELLIAKVKLRFCNVKQPSATPKFDVEMIPDAYDIEIKNIFDSLNFTETEPEELWKDIKVHINDVAHQLISYKKKAKWMSETMTVVAEQRRKAKIIGNREKMQRLNVKFQKEARKDKGKFWEEQCKKMEAATQKGLIRQCFTYVKKA
ncbi:uncharacterized protein LOC111624491 [Centruroides sculpturatus]|uniref:uncharacterized protein LOC111624491 n=1 Tax=Centruroides sculpturatus TaxID=218467 RepID=UPI000C6D4B82|nr:uncharacterized protein LOC111624491 [Centruroides sculpturatus]